MKTKKRHKSDYDYTYSLYSVSVTCPHNTSIMNLGHKNLKHNAATLAN